MPQIPDGVGGLASTRRGILLRPDLLANKINDDQISSLVRSGLLQRAHAGALHASTDVEVPWEQQLAAAAFSIPSALASFTSAARLRRYDGIRTSMLEVTIPYGLGGGPTEGVKVHRSRRLLEADEVNGIPIVTAEQTLLDIASVKSVPGRDVLKALASALRTGQTTLPKLDMFLGTCGRGVRGTQRLRVAVQRYQDGSPPPGSDGEVAMFEFFELRGIELPTRQFEITLPSGLHLYLDFAWDLRMKTIEFDGLASRSSPDAHDAELQRQNVILELGWDLRRFSPIALRERPKQTYLEIVRFLES